MDLNNDYFLTSWLGQQEDQHKISLYQCDFTYTAWTKRCIRQADCVLIVGLGDSAPSLGKVRTFLILINIEFKIICMFLFRWKKKLRGWQ